MENKTKLINTQLEKIVNRRFKKKYKIDQNRYNIYAIESIIFNDKTHLVALFKEYLIIDDDYEFLKRYYTKDESKTRLIKYIQYYETYNFLYPNYTSIPESKFIYHNIHKKQKILDEQEQKGKVKSEKEKKNSLNSVSLSQSKNTIFDSSVYNSIIQNNSNLYSTIFGIEVNGKNNKNDSITEINKLIKIIETYDSNIYKYKKNVKNLQIGIGSRFIKNNTNQNIKKPDSSLINPNSNNSSNFLNTAMPVQKLKSFASLYIKNVFRQKYSKQNEKNKLSNNWKKNTVINNNSTKTSSNFGTQLVYQKLNPIDDTKKKKYLTVKNSTEKNKKEINKKYSKLPLEKIGKYYKYDRNSAINKNIYVNKTNTLNMKDIFQKHISCTNSLVPLAKIIPEGQLINSKNNRDTSSNSFNSNSEEKLIYQKRLQNTSKKSDNKFIYKKLITNNNICQTVTNNNDNNKNKIFKELELFKLKAKKKLNKLNPLKINTNDISNLSHKSRIKSALLTDVNQIQYKKKQVPASQNSINNNSQNKTNKINVRDSYSKKKIIYSSEKNKYYQRYHNNSNIQLIPPSKKLKTLTINNNFKNSTFIRSSKNMTSMTTRNNYSISGNTTYKQTPIIKTELLNSIKKIKNTTSNFNNKKLLTFKKLLNNSSKNDGDNKKYIGKSKILFPELPKKINPRFYHRYNYAQTESSLNDYIDKNLNKKNVLNEDTNNRYLKTESKKDGNSKNKMKKKILIIKKVHKASIDTMNTNLSNYNYNTEKTIDYINYNFPRNENNCKTERWENNSIKKIKYYENKKINQILASSNIECYKIKLNIKNQKLQNNEKNNIGGKKLIMNKNKYNNNHHLK